VGVSYARTASCRRVRSAAAASSGSPGEDLGERPGQCGIVKLRIAGLLEVIRDAAPIDADTAALWDLIQSDFYDNQREIVKVLHRKKALRPKVDVSRAADILWTLNHPNVWFLLVGERGWTPEQFEQWLADTSCAQLLK
jgi:hypothetical protein